MTLMSKNYRVLWIDDEHETHGATLKGDALDHDIILVGYTSVDEGFVHLREDLSRYDAILLDAKSFEKKDQQPVNYSNVDFLSRTYQGRQLGS